MPTALVRTDSDSREVLSTKPSTTRPLRVCIVAPSLAILGGQSINAERLMERLRLDPALEISFLPHDPQLPRPFRSLQRIKYVRTVVTSAALLTSLVRHLRRQDVVHVFSASYWSFLLAPTPTILIGRMYGKRVILNYRSGHAENHLTRFKRTALPVFRRASHIVVPSGYLVDVFAKFGLTAEAIGNFVDLDDIPYRRRRNLQPVFLANRNFGRHYNVACALRAFALIQRERPEAKLIVAGDGEQRSMLHELARELGLRNVEFLGQVPPERMPSLYDAVDIYLNSPNVDNMPNSVIESFAAGLPVVTTNAGGIPYIVTHNQTGMLVDCDDHATMARYALQLLDDPDHVERMTDRARNEVLTRYTWQAVHHSWRKAYGL
jgi:glycosyltransferase involved in cell wall biosynthesis